jgi:hypothetical protein
MISSSNSKRQSKLNDFNALPVLLMKVVIPFPTFRMFGNLQSEDFSFGEMSNAS